MLISLITVCYNSGKTIADTLRSVRDQTYPHIEHIVVDGLSTDNTIEQVRQFPHVARIISGKDNGIYDAMNKGIAAATGEVVGIINSDDVYNSADVLSKVATAFTNANVKALYADLEYVHAENLEQVMRFWRSGPYRQKLFYFGWMPPHPTFFVRKELYEQYGGFNTSLSKSADYELMLRFLVKHRVTPVYLNEVIVKMRVGGVSNATLGNRLKANKEDKLAWDINGLKPHGFTTYLKPFRKLPQFLVRVKAKWNRMKTHSG